MPVFAREEHDGRARGRRRRRGGRARRALQRLPGDQEHRHRGRHRHPGRPGRVGSGDHHGRLGGVAGPDPGTVRRSTRTRLRAAGSGRHLRGAALADARDHQHRGDLDQPFRSRSRPASDRAQPRDSTDVPKAIPDNNPAGVDLDACAWPTRGRSQDVNVRIGSLTHTFVGDLKLELTSPTGTIVVLANRPGGTGNSGDNFTGTVFDDEASVALGRGRDERPVHGVLQAAGGPALAFRRREPAGHLDAEGVRSGRRRTRERCNAWGLDIATVSLRLRAGRRRPGNRPGSCATAGADSVALDWDDTADRHGLRDLPSRPGRAAIRANPTATTTSSAFTDSGRTPGQEYCYKVGALNGAQAPARCRRSAARRCRCPPACQARRRSTWRPPGGAAARAHARPLRAAALDPGQPDGHLRAQLPRHGRPGRARLKITTVKAVAAARKRKAGGGPEVLHRSRPAGGRELKVRLNRKGLRVLKRVQAAPRVREGHARDPHGHAPGHAARPPAAALSRVPSA